MNYTQQHIKETINKNAALVTTNKSDESRLFFSGVGGGARNCAHYVKFFPNIIEIESYALTDNDCELPACTNDEDWPSNFKQILKISKLNAIDAVFVLSVGRDFEKNNSPNLVEAIQYVHAFSAKITGIVEGDGGFTARVADACVIILTVNCQNITPYSEVFQAVISYSLFSHPALESKQTEGKSKIQSYEKSYRIAS